VKEKLIRALEIAATALIFSTQTILESGYFISIMAIPLLPYIMRYITGPYGFNQIISEFMMMTVSSRFIVGRLVALAGVIVLLVSVRQWLREHKRSTGLFRTGFYAKVRHPQFLGIILITLGLTIMTLTWGTSSITELTGLWFLQVIGYLAIAKFEDWRLSKKFSDEHAEYKRKVPLIYPIKRPRKIPEIPFTIMITLAICLVLLVLPYDLIRIYSYKLYDGPITTWLWG
jgi:protein-S-isoprenylcysteine O-methyltransferase Ste14